MPSCKWPIPKVMFVGDLNSSFSFGKADLYFRLPRSTACMSLEHDLPRALLIGQVSFNPLNLRSKFEFLFVAPIPFLQK